MSGGFKNRKNSGTELTAGELLWVQTGTAGVLLLKEQASAPGATSDYGKVYVKDSDHNLYYKDEAGNEFQLNSGGSGVSVETPVGTVNALNATFTPSAEPLWMVGDGITYLAGAGYTWTGTDINMDVPPSQYIRAII